MKSMIVCFGTCWAFAALATIALKEVPQPASYSASDRAGMDQLIEQVTLPAMRKTKPVAMPDKKGIHWVSLAKAAATTPSDGLEYVYAAYYQQRKVKQ